MLRGGHGRCWEAAETPFIISEAEGHVTAALKVRVAGLQGRGHPGGIRT